jgi:hypothetical protein
MPHFRDSLRKYVSVGGVRLGGRSKAEQAGWILTAPRTRACLRGAVGAAFYIRTRKYMVGCHHAFIWWKPSALP